MTREEFLNRVIVLLELENELQFSIETKIEDILEVDSLAHVSIISFINQNFKIEIEIDEFSKFDTVNDILDFIGVA